MRQDVNRNTASLFSTKNGAMHYLELFATFGSNHHADFHYLDVIRLYYVIDRTSYIMGDVTPLFKAAMLESTTEWLPR